MRSFFAQSVFSFAYLAAMAMVAFEVSPMITLFGAIFVVWRWGLDRWQWPALPKRMIAILSVFLLILILLQFRTLVGQEPGFTFLLGLSALKLMDYETDVDHKILTLLGFILMSAKALFSFDIYWLPMMVLVFYGLWYGLMPPSFANRNKLLVKIILFALPLTLVLFGFFPRFVVPWAISQSDLRLGQTGFSNSLMPGQVAELANDTAVAFRAKFEQVDFATGSDLYWRGGVLVESAGLNWQAGKQLPGRKSLDGATLDLTYQVAMEPHAEEHLFVLDGTQRVQLEGVAVIPLTGAVFKAKAPSTKTVIYSADAKRVWQDEEQPQTLHLQTPLLPGKVQDWVQMISAKSLSVEEKLAELNNFFANSNFVYTLRPGAYSENGLEEFLFQRRRGFCEHFAGSYATLARALGIPSRVVVGYQGGVYNPLGGFWKIVNKDAHAWVEVFHDNHWQRMDPTTWVAPLRFAIGAEEFFSLSEQDQIAFAKNKQWRSSTESLQSLVKAISFWLENLNYQWTYFLIDYDRSAQENLFLKFKDHWKEVFLTILLSLGALIGIVIFVASRVQRRRLENWLLLPVFKWGARQGFPRAESEASFSYLERLQRSLPAHFEALEFIKSFYDRVRFGGEEMQKDDSQRARLWIRTLD